MRFLLSPLNVHRPFVQSMNSFRSISEVLLPLVFFQFFLYSTMINSTGAITYGADALFHEMMSPENYQATGDSSMGYDLETDLDRFVNPNDTVSS